MPGAHGDAVDECQGHLAWLQAEGEALVQAHQRQLGLLQKFGRAREGQGLYRKELYRKTGMYGRNSMYGRGPHVSMHEVVHLPLQAYAHAMCRHAMWQVNVWGACT